MSEQLQPNIPPVISEVRQPAVKPKPRRRLGIGVAVASLAFALAVALFVGTGPSSTAEHSVKQLILAAQRQDRQGVSQYVDAEAYAKSARVAIKSALHKETAKNSDGGIFDTLLGAGVNYITDGMVDVMITPESVVSTLAGQSGSDVMKENFSSAADQKIDSFTSQGDWKTQAGGIVAKCLANGLISYAVDKATPTNEVASAGKNHVTAVYESSDRFLIRATCRDATQPSFGYVFRRYSYSTWKLSELCIYENKVARTEQASR
jgi:hypothetical protein